MASVSISHTIVFIASIVVAASVAGVLTSQVGQISEAIDDRGLDVSQKIRADMEIISDTGSDNCCYDDSTNNVTLLVKNVGSRELSTDPAQMDVIVDGEYEADVTVSVVDGSAWEPGNVVEVKIEIQGGLAQGDHRVKLIVKGDEEVVEFRGGE